MSSIPTTGQALRATFYELGLNSDQPAQLAAFYNKTLGYQFGGAEGGLGIARDRRISILRGEPKTLAYAAYAVPDETVLLALEHRLLAAGVAVERIAMVGFAGEAIAFRDPDGNMMRFGIVDGESGSGDTIADRPARIQHAVFASTGIDRMLAFYTDVVGFVLSDTVNDEGGTMRTFFVRCSHEHHSLAVFSAAENRLDHHCYEAADWNLIRDWADHFAKQRIPLKWGPGRHGPGDNLFVFIHDPDGNWLEISAELEQVTPDRPVGTWPHEEYTLNSWGIGLLRS